MHRAHTAFRPSRRLTFAFTRNRANFAFKALNIRFYSRSQAKQKWLRRSELKIFAGDKICVQNRKILRSNSPFCRNFKRETNLNAVRKISDKARRESVAVSKFLSLIKDAREATSKILKQRRITSKRTRELQKRFRDDTRFTSDTTSSTAKLTASIIPA